MNKIGKLLNADYTDELSVQIFEKRGGKFAETGIVEIVNTNKCYCGSFDLTNSGNIPVRIRDKIVNNNITGII